MRFFFQWTLKHLSSGWSFIRVVSHQGGLLSLGWSLIIRVIFHCQGGLLAGWSLIRVVSYQGGLPLGWSLSKVFFYIFFIRGSTAITMKLNIADKVQWKAKAENSVLNLMCLTWWLICELVTQVVQQEVDIIIRPAHHMLQHLQVFVQVSPEEPSDVSLPDCWLYHTWHHCCLSRQMLFQLFQSILYLTAQMSYN